MAKVVWVSVALVLISLTPVLSVTAEENTDSQVGAAASAVASSATATPDEGGSESSAEENVSHSSNILSRLEVHGFLSQAYVDGKFNGNRVPGQGGADPGPTFDELAIGIPEDGTSDYRTMALQFRYQISPRDLMVVQLSSRALGFSPISDFEDEIELDWAFYERRIGDNAALKVGRVQIPIGIFNEIRDVGTILPFYRPSFVFYREGTFTTETVDGALINNTFFAESDWSLEFDVYAGSWKEFELTPVSTQQVTLADDEGYGGQLWLNTPVTGLRFGLGAQKRQTSGGSEGINRPVGGKTDFFDWYTSVDAVFDKFVIRGEYRENTNKAAPFPAFLASDFRSVAVLYYVQAGIHPTDKFRIYAQAEYSTSKNSASIFVDDFTIDFRRDYGIAINYLFNPGLVFKAEYHEVEGEDVGVIPVFTPQGLRLQLFAQELDAGNYFIVSLSASF